MPRKQPKLPPCPWCRKPADRECDGAIAVAEGADRRDPKQTTCSAPVCSKCSQHVQAARPFTAIVCSRGRGGRGCEVIDNRADLCPFCAGRQGADPLPRAEHDEQLAQAIADALERKVIRGRFGERDNKPENITVMVDELRQWPHARGQFKAGSCHLTVNGDTPEHLQALHDLAARIGLRREWFQAHPRHPHYDLTASKRPAAIAAGAVEVDAREQARERLTRHGMLRGPSKSTAPSQVRGPSESANPQFFEHGPQPGERLYLIDGGIVHRCYHAVPLEFAPSKPEQPVNALLGFLRALRKMRKRLLPKPQWFLPIFDGDGPGWREQLHPGYKADRPEQEPELRSQWQPIRELLDAMGVGYVQQPGVEADDMIASYTEVAVKRGLEVVIVSNDKDLLQLVCGDGGPGSVRCMSAFGELELRGPEYVVEKFGVRADQLADYLALAGDKVDGIPGAPGIGPVTAARLLSDPETDTLGKLFDQWQLLRPTKVSDAIGKNRDKILLSRELVELRREPLPIPLHELRPWAVTRSSLDNYFARLGYPRFEAALDRYEDK